MTRVLWILAVVTPAVQQVALLLFGGAVERALMAAGTSPRQLSATINRAFSALLVLTSGVGVYAAGKAHRGGWVAIFGVAIVLGLDGPTAAAVAVPHLTFGRTFGCAAVTYLQILDRVLGALVPLATLAYALRYRQGHRAPSLARANST